MNTNLSAAVRRLSWHILFTALMATAAFQAEARPVLPIFFGPPEISPISEPADTRLWRYVPIGPCGRWMPVEGSAIRSSAPPREVVRWVGPRGTVPVYRDK